MIWRLMRALSPIPAVWSFPSSVINLKFGMSFIDNNCLEYLKDCKANLGKFYLLPKVHESIVKLS